MQFSIDTRNMKANELALLAAVTRGMERRAVKSALKNLVGREVSDRLVDSADKFSDELIDMDAKAEAEHEEIVRRSQRMMQEQIDLMTPEDLRLFHQMND